MAAAVAVAMACRWRVLTARLVTRHYSPVLTAYAIVRGATYTWIG